MNYLAHVFLSRESPAAIVGALLGDFIKGPLGVQAQVASPYSPDVCAAILRHRAIDRYTDAHPVVFASRALVSPARRRFAPILVDVFYDHFLARRWQEYCDLPLPAFAQQVYAVLHAHREHLPQRLQGVAPRMAQNDWFVAYTHVHGIDAAVNGIARRLERHPRAAALHGGAEELERHYAALDAHFCQFFPQLIEFVGTARAAAGEIIGKQPAPGALPIA